MKKITLFVTICFGLLAFTVNHFDDEPEISKSQKTGIILDSMNNEVLLIFINDLPAYYKSEIFTPVCNTGECLPVYVNMYWNLNGEFLRFDQPEGEILTKLDHQPFTEDDYKLLDEILKGPDPRIASLSHGADNSQVKHNKGDKQDSQAMPAPSLNTIQMDKHDMVDGISGATLPEIKSQFVPGALYTTYTLWGLANDSNYKIKKYTTDNLFIKYSRHLIGNKDLESQGDVINWMASKSTDENARLNVLIDLINTGDSTLQLAAFSQMYAKYYFLDETQELLDKTFYSGKVAESVQKQIIHKWAHNNIGPNVLPKLTNHLLEYEKYFPEIMALYSNKIDYPEGVIAKLIETLPELKEENQVIIKDFFVTQKEYFSKEDLDLIESIE